MFSRHSNSNSRHRNILHPAPDATSSASVSNAPMAIPHAREHVPPPLPPPQLIPELNDGDDSGWQLQNDPSSDDFAKPISIKPGSSLLGGFHRPSSLERENGFPTKQSPSFAGRNTVLPTISPILASRDVEMTNGSVTEDGHGSARVSPDYRYFAAPKMLLYTNLLSDFVVNDDWSKMLSAILHKHMINRFLTRSVVQVLLDNLYLHLHLHMNWLRLAAKQDVTVKHGYLLSPSHPSRSGLHLPQHPAGRISIRGRTAYRMTSSVDTTATSNQSCHRMI